jgi:nucleoside-diphosphate-sugar epimerase
MASNMTKTNVYNIGAEEMGTVKEDLQRLIKHSGKSSRLMSLPVGFTKFALEITSKIGVAPLMNEQFSIADKNFKLDTTRAQQEFGWQPTKSNYDTLKEAYDWYCENVKGSKKQFKSIFSVFGKFNHSQQGAFQKTGKESDFNKL